jgi:hypothetical protein
MEKSLCIAKTLLTSSGLDKREKGAKEATLLRGVRELPGNVLEKLAKAIRSSVGAEIEFAHPAAAASEPAKRSLLAPSARSASRR